MLRYLLLLACLASTGCGQLAVAGYFLLRNDTGSSSHGGGGGAMAVGPAGGTLSTAEATVTVPPGAVSGDVTLTVAAGTQIQQFGFVTVGQPVRLGPEGQTFAQPVRVRLPFDPGALPAGSTVADLVVLKRSDATGQVTVLRPTQTGSSLVVEVTSFSTFQPAVQAGADPGTSSVAAVPSAVSADGISTSTVTVLVRDAAGRPLVGQAVALVTSSSSIAIQQPAPTGPDGRTTGTLSSGTAQVVSVTASAGSVELGRVGVQFLQPGPPSAPTLSLVSRAAFDVRLAWTPVPGVTGYRLELPGPVGTEVSLGADTTTYTDTSIGLDQGWGYRVFSVNAYGSTPSNTVTVFPAPATSTLLVDLPPVVDLVAPTAGDAIAGVTTITWTTTDSNPSRAEVQLSADGGATWPQVLYEGPDTGSVSWDSSDVPDGTSYRIRVTATDTNGNRSVPAASGDFQATRTDHRLSWVKVTEPIHDLVALRPDGEIYVVGTLTSARDLVFGPGEVNETTLPQAPAGSQYRYLARYDSAGALRWAVQVGAGATHTVVAAPVVTADGGVLLAGQNTSGTSLTLGSAGGTQIALAHDACFLARYDSAGELLWVRELHDAPYGAQVTSDSSLLGLELYPDGSYVVAGRFSGELDLGGTSLFSVSDDNTDAFVARYSSAGALQWASHGGPVMLLNDLALLDDGTVVATGEYLHTDVPRWFLEGTPQALPRTGGAHVWVAAWSADGTPRWLQHHGGTTNETALTLAPRGDDVILVGQFGSNSSDTLVLGNGTPQELVFAHAARRSGGFQVAITSSGAIDWIRYDLGADGASHTHHAATRHTGAGHLVLANTNSTAFGAGETNETLVQGATGGAGALARYTRDGRLAWVHRVVGESVAPRHLAVAPDGSYVAIGWFQGVTTFAAGEPGEQSAGAVGVGAGFMLKFEAE